MISCITVLLLNSEKADLKISEAPAELIWKLILYTNAIVCQGMIVYE